MKFHAAARAFALMVPVVLSSACADRIVRAAPDEMAQAPERTPQEVRTPLPPPVATRADEPESTPASSGPAPGPYVRVEIAHSKSRSADFRDDKAVSPDCFIAVNYPGVCGASLDRMGSGQALSVGVGYRFGNGFRADVTYGRRKGYELRGYDPEGTYFDPPITSDSLLAGLYYDFPVMLGIVRPFVGGGVGKSRNEMDPILWYDTTSSGKLPGGKKNSFAWQFSAGANVLLSEGLVLEVGYRYMDMGKFKKSAGPDLVGNFNAPGVGTGGATGHLRADEIYLGIRRDF